jgi:CTP:molybdopterin cytidylyltransferase MocA
MKSNIAILLLAAGGSTRLGFPKQLIDVNGETLVRRVARVLVALDAGPVGVVIGSERDAIEASLRDLPVSIIANVNWKNGIGTSIRAGVAWAQTCEVDALMICLCDQPKIEAKHLQSLIARRAECDVDIVATRYSGSKGVPAVFVRDVFEKLASLPDDRGAKGLFGDGSLRVEAVACEDASIDLDTPEDVRRWRAD